MHVMGGWDKHGFLVKMFPSIQNNEVGLADYLQLCRVEIEDISKDFFWKLWTTNDGHHLVANILTGDKATYTSIPFDEILVGSYFFTTGQNNQLQEAV